MNRCLLIDVWPVWNWLLHFASDGLCTPGALVIYSRIWLCVYHWPRGGCPYIEHTVPRLDLFIYVKWQSYTQQWHGFSTATADRRNDRAGWRRIPCCDTCTHHKFYTPDDWSRRSACAFTAPDQKGSIFVMATAASRPHCECALSVAFVVISFRFIFYFFAYLTYATCVTCVWCVCTTKG